MSNINKKLREIFPCDLYLVGGAVRDYLLNKSPKDLDYTTASSPDFIEKSIRDNHIKPYLIGKKFGTIGMKLDGNYVEITTFRAEKYKENNRKPDVEFVTNIYADLSRRDFTINALAYSLQTEKILDFFEGKKNLDDKIIKSVNNPTIRFKEDPLRLLRACRFASQLGFDIEEATLKSLNKLSYKILSISKERWVAELDKLLLGDYVEKGLNYLMSSRLLNFIIPELSLQLNYNQNSKYHSLTLWEHTVKAVGLANNTDINVKWALLLHDIAKPFVRTDKIDRSNYIFHAKLGREIVLKTARYLNWSNDRTKIVSNLVENHLNEDCFLRYFDNKAK